MAPPARRAVVSRRFPAGPRSSTRVRDKISPGRLTGPACPPRKCQIRGSGSCVDAQRRIVRRTPRNPDLAGPSRTYDRPARARRPPRWIAPQRAPKVATRAVPRAGAASTASAVSAARSVRPLTWSGSSFLAARAPSPGEDIRHPDGVSRDPGRELHHRLRGLPPALRRARAPGEHAANRMARLQARPRGSPRQVVFASGSRGRRAGHPGRRAGRRGRRGGPRAGRRGG